MGTLHSIACIILMGLSFNAYARSLEKGGKGCNYVIARKKGTIDSPGYPFSYSNDLDCTWQIKAKVGMRIVLQIEDFQLEESKFCDFDTVTIFDGELNQSPLLRTLCGLQPPEQLTSTDNMFSFRFKTDSSEVKKGFRFTFRTEKGCGEIFRHPSGVITSPNYPQRYPADQNCKYEINVARGKSIVLYWETFQMEDMLYGQCFDYITLYRPGPGVRSLVGQYCGMAGPPTQICLPATELVMEFVTDHAENFAGFKVNYETKDEPCKEIKVSDADEVFDVRAGLDQAGIDQDILKVLLHDSQRIGSGIVGEEALADTDPSLQILNADELGLIHLLENKKEEPELMQPKRVKPTTTILLQQITSSKLTKLKGDVYPFETISLQATNHQFLQSSRRTQNVDQFAEATPSLSSLYHAKITTSERVSDETKVFKNEFAQAYPLARTSIQDTEHHSISHHSTSTQPINSSRRMTSRMVLSTGIRIGFSGRLMSSRQLFQPLEQKQSTMRSISNRLHSEINKSVTEKANTFSNGPTTNQSTKETTQSYMNNNLLIMSTLASFNARTSPFHQSFGFKIQTVNNGQNKPSVPTISGEINDAESTIDNGITFKHHPVTMTASLSSYKLRQEGSKIESYIIISSHENVSKSSTFTSPSINRISSSTVSIATLDILYTKSLQAPTINNKPPTTTSMVPEMITKNHAKVTQELQQINATASSKSTQSTMRSHGTMEKADRSKAMVNHNVNAKRLIVEPTEVTHTANITPKLATTENQKQAMMTQVLLTASRQHLKSMPFSLLTSPKVHNTNKQKISAKQVRRSATRARRVAETESQKYIVYATESVSTVTTSTSIKSWTDNTLIQHIPSTITTYQYNKKDPEKKTEAPIITIPISKQQHQMCSNYALMAHNEKQKQQHEDILHRPIKITHKVQWPYMGILGELGFIHSAVIGRTSNDGIFVLHSEIDSIYIAFTNKFPTLSKRVDVINCNIENETTDIMKYINRQYPGYNHIMVSDCRQPASR